MKKTKELLGFKIQGMDCAEEAEEAEKVTAPKREIDAAHTWARFGSVAKEVVTGIGFLGAGVILHDRGNVVGLTTAATLWATASVGLAAGYGMYTLAVLC